LCAFGLLSEELSRRICPLFTGGLSDVNFGFFPGFGEVITSASFQGYAKFLQPKAMFKYMYDMNQWLSWKVPEAVI
jgi:hypothetical protein